MPLSHTAYHVVLLLWLISAYLSINFCSNWNLCKSCSHWSHGRGSYLKSPLKVLKLKHSCLKSVCKSSTCIRTATEDVYGSGNSTGTGFLRNLTTPHLLQAFLEPSALEPGGLPWQRRRRCGHWPGLDPQHLAHLPRNWCSGPCAACEPKTK